MFLHPRCPCSAASVEELAHLIAQCGNRVNASVIVFKPSDQADEWSITKTLANASAIPGVAVQFDRNGALSRKFGASTSGQVMLYDRDGRLLYAGGITGSRGHVGDNNGLDTVTRLILDPASAGKIPVVSPVFGCEIYSNCCPVQAPNKDLK